MTINWLRLKVDKHLLFVRIFVLLWKSGWILSKYCGVLYFRSYEAYGAKMQNCIYCRRSINKILFKIYYLLISDKYRIIPVVNVSSIILSNSKIICLISSSIVCIPLFRWTQCQYLVPLRLNFCLLRHSSVSNCWICSCTISWP